MSERVVVVGAGHAAGQFAARVRAEGFEGEVVLLGDEGQVPYQRPPLSKAYLAGEVELDRVLLRKPSFYEEQNVSVRLNCHVAAVDREALTVTLDDDETLSFTHLVFATGARVRRLPLPGVALPGVHYIRTLADSGGLRAALTAGASMVVIGGGYIGLEAAAIGAKAGMQVTVLEAQSRILARVSPPQIAEHIASVHASHGVNIRTEVAVASIEGEEKASAVVLVDGERIEADVVVVGIGVSPCTEVAADAGLEVDDGIVVDAQGRTNDPHIWAIGDCTRHPSRIYGRNVRLESVHNAMSQAKVVAANVAGKSATYDEVPWFWSDQYDMKLQIAGLGEGADNVVVRGDAASGNFTVFSMRGDVVLAADSINAMRDHMECRKLAASGKAIDRVRLADSGVPLKEISAG